MPEEYQVNHLIYLMGEEAENRLDRFGLTLDERQDYRKVIDSFDNHFKGAIILVYERSKFFARMQGKGEPVELFIADLNKIVNRCNFDKIKGSLIIHKIIQDMVNIQVSEKLQLESRMTLAMVEEKAKVAEWSRQQQRIVRGENHD